ncbi:hypothetical protein ECANGB1_1022 [Enterospora canceri]|uniref:Uncharacterized protein n=1 Tax=Enterospora canceri TaxID=1081671 RepID=A0A1Y1S7P2_9MICR|nr:hypothetical protein ECANGB1_1022 [Enterospora canceri]
MENIEFFTAQCKKAGVKDENNFMTVDLYEKKNMEAVKIAIVAFARALNSSNTGVHLIGPNEMKTGEKTRDHNSSESAMTNKSVK